MSIAVSAVLRPSRLLRLALSMHALAAAAAAVALACGAGGRFPFPLALAACCALSALVAGRAAAALQTTRRIDISGLGEIRLTVQQSMGRADAAHDPLRLLPGSTIWPRLLLLLLRDAQQGPELVLMILPDSVSDEQFRKLAVAIMAIARRDNKFVEKHKIH